MTLTAEISMYPLRKDYQQPILAFIERLRKKPGIKVSTNAMSTQISGPYEEVFALLQAEMRLSFDRHGKSVMVVKFIPDALPILEPPTNHE